jgi:hypothetical protein
MASMNPSAPPSKTDDRIAWNEAYIRLEDFLKTFRLSEEAATSRVALKILDKARELYRQDHSRHPTTLVMEQTQATLAEWLQSNLEEQGKNPSQGFSSGCIALLLSRLYATAPEAFLASPLPNDLRQSMRQTLLVTGPDLNVSSMTPRRLDYGPMLTLARHTWHRWNINEILIAMLFWAGIYIIFYWWLSEVL